MYYFKIDISRPDNLEQKIYQKLEEKQYPYAYINTIFNVLKKGNILIEDASEDELIALKQALQIDSEKIEAAIIAIQKGIDINKVLLPGIDNETAKILTFGYIHKFDLSNFCKYGSKIMYGIYDNIKYLNDLKVLDKPAFFNGLDKLDKLDKTRLTNDGCAEIVHYIAEHLNDAEQYEKLLKCIPKGKINILSNTVILSEKLVKNGVNSVRKSFDSQWEFLNFVREKIN